MTKLIIPKDTSLMATLSLIEETLSKSPKPLSIDMSDVSFPLTRDVFFVLKKRFRVDEFNLLLRHEYEVDMARSIWIWASISWLRAEFDREFSKKNILKHNFTMWEYFLYEMRRWWDYIIFLFTRKRAKTPMYKVKKWSPNMFLIVAGLIMSLSLLLFIFHFAVSKTYVYITPQISVRPISSNITFSQSTGSVFAQGKNVVRMKSVTIPVEHTMKFALDTIDPNSATIAAWRATLYNELTVEQVLKPNTRFVTEDGIVFRSESWVNIPAAKTVNGIMEIGTVEVSLKADGLDEAGKIIWIRWNIPSTTYLSIPGLKFNRDKVYAKAKESFIGGADPKIHIVTDPELTRLRGILHEQMVRMSRDTLQSKLDESNKEYGENFALLMASTVTLTGETITITSGQKIGDLANEIELHGSVMVNALVYDKKAVIDYLTTIFRERLLNGTDKELGIHEDTLRMTNVISRSEGDQSIKATMEMNASITYDLENSTNELTRRMKVTIAGLSKSDAITRLINGWQVREVDIRFSPFWMSSVSSKLDNIEFVIKNK